MDILDLNNLNPSTDNEKNLERSIEIRKKTNDVYSKVARYDREVYMNIINDYSKSLAFLPSIQSEEYAMTLGNRSAVLKRVLKLKESIIDLDAALKITENSELKFKLLCRKIECLATLNKKSEITEYYGEALKIAQSFNKNQKDIYLKKLNKALQIKPSVIPNEIKQDIDVSNFISDAISWNYNEKYGNHLVANRDIRTGEKLIIENFYLGYPNIEKLYIICSNCLNFTLNSIPCKSCVYAVFCSEACMKKAWNKFHEIECKIYQIFSKHLKFSNICVNYLQTVRLFSTALKEKGGIENLIKKAEEIDKKKK